MLFVRFLPPYGDEGLASVGLGLDVEKHRQWLDWEDALKKKKGSFFSLI